MEELFSFVLLLLFFLAPLIARVFKGGEEDDEGVEKTPPRPKRQRTGGPRERAGRGVGQGGTRNRGGEGESAAEMLPEDLWAVLTGEKPAPSRPERVPEPRGGEVPERRPERFPMPESDTKPERRESPEPVESPVPLPEPEPAAVPEPPAPVPSAELSDVLRARRAGRRRERQPVASLFRGRDDLRRAVILREVLGPPKGLE